jgi:glycogen(starch) synthase
MTSRHELHVLATTDAVGAVWTHSSALAEAAAPLGMRFTLAVIGPPPHPEALRAVQRQGNVQIVIHPTKLEWMDSPRSDVDAASEWVRALERTCAPDVAQVNGYALASARSTAPVLVVAQSCALSWWRAVRGKEAPAEWDAYRCRAARGLAAAAHIAVPTHSMLRTLRRDHELQAAISVIPNGRQAPRSVARPSRTAQIAAVGRLWDEAKYVAAVAEVAARLPWPCHLAGDAACPDGGRSAFEKVQLLRGSTNALSGGSGTLRRSSRTRRVVSRPDSRRWRPRSRTALSCSGGPIRCRRSGGMTLCSSTRTNCMRRSHASFVSPHLPPRSRHTRLHVRSGSIHSRSATRTHTSAAN